PAHVSLADHGLTFATNPDKGVCIRFEEPVRGLDPLGLVLHPGLTVTVDDPAGLAELLDRTSHNADRTHTPEQDMTVEDLLAEASDELISLTASELRQRARDRGIRNSSRMAKSELIDLLSASDHVVESDDVSEAPPTETTANGDESGV